MQQDEQHLPTFIQLLSKRTMNDDATRTIEDRLQALTPQPMKLDAEAVLAAAGRSADEDCATRRRSMVTADRQRLSLAAACVVGMLVGSMMTALLMRTETGSSTAALQSEPSVVGSASPDHDATESEAIPRAVESEPMLMDLATDDGDAARRVEDSPMTDYPTFDRNGLTYSTRQQRFLGTSDSIAAADIIADDDVLPAGVNAANGGASPRRSLDRSLYRRDRLMQELLRM